MHDFCEANSLTKNYNFYSTTACLNMAKSSWSMRNSSRFLIICPVNSYFILAMQI